MEEIDQENKTRRWKPKRYGFGRYVTERQAKQTMLFFLGGSIGLIISSGALLGFFGAIGAASIVAILCGILPNTFIIDDEGNILSDEEISK